MKDADNLLLDLIRLGLLGDGNSVLLYARKLLRRPPEIVVDQSTFKAGLARLLADAGGQRAMRSTRTPTPPHSETSEGDLTVTMDTNHTPASRPVLGPEEAKAVQKVLLERKRSQELARSGIEPTKTLLLTGAPGVGKTMTARFIAAELGLPLMTVNLAAVVSSYLGKTGQNVRQLIDRARGTPCVLFLDEFDALAKRRDDSSDVGELKRIVNVLLLELEHWPAHSLLVAATNHPNLLDPAVWRRFDVVINLGLPDELRREAILADVVRCAGLAVSPHATRLAAETMAGASGSEVARVARASVRAVVLGESAHMDQAVLRATIEMLGKGGRVPQEGRVAFCLLAHSSGEFSQREIGALLGVSHVTIGRILGRVKGTQGATSRKRSAV